jgi:ABC-type phosphate transport system substrate-binding protein
MRVENSGITSIDTGDYAVPENQKAVLHLRFPDSDQVQGLFTGKIANWSQIGGHDLPVHLVGRNPDSGSRATFEQRFPAENR